MLIPLLANAEVVDGINYELNKGAKTAEVTRNDYSGALTVPSGITVEGVEYAVTSIGYAAFEYCTGLTSVDIPNSVTTIGNRAFHDCTGLTSVTLGNSVQGINTFAFFGCTGLTTLTIPESVTNIGNNAFGECVNLSRVSIPESLSDIGVGVFSGCYGLTSIIIPEGITCIGEYAFRGCDGLKEVYCYAVEVPEIDPNVLQNIEIEKLTLYVPEESFEAYKSTEPWKNFGAIVPISKGNSIEDLMNDGTGVSAIYTLDGKHATDGSRGILIIRQADGTTKKVLKK